MRMTCGTLPFQYPLMPSLLPMAMNAGMRPPDAAALAAAVCWLALEICMMIFRRSSGAVHVLASAPAVPPARKSAKPVPMTCVMTATGLRCMSRDTVSLGVSSESAVAAAGFAATHAMGLAIIAPVRDANLGLWRNATVAPDLAVARSVAPSPMPRGDASLRPLAIIPPDVSLLCLPNIFRDVLFQMTRCASRCAGGLLDRCAPEDVDPPSLACSSPSCAPAMCPGRGIRRG